jgi:nitrogen fixation/metabolism regulation signal transduction histidine kinase
MLKNFRLQIIFRVLLLALSMGVCIYLWLETAFYVSAALLSLLVIYQTIRLIRYVELTNRKLGRFLSSIRYSDFSRSFSGRQLGKSFRKLDEAFAKVVEAFKDQRIEKQTQFRYMQTVVQHIGIGLVSFNQQGEVELINTAAKRLFQVATLRRIDDLSAVSPNLVDAIGRLKAGERRVVRIFINNKALQLAIHATTFRLRDEMFKLVSFQDINAELEDKEMEAWQNLTEVMAHEIMNSVTPIASLSDTVRMLIKENTREAEDDFLLQRETVKDVTEALETIENRSRGLIRFVNSYRDFTKEPEPDVELFSVKKMLQRVRNLNKGEAAAQQISIAVSVEPDTLEVTADPHLVEQVLINLIKNAFRALSERDEGTISLSGNIASGGGICIQVHDDGPGINPDKLDKIFIPFYSTGRPQEGHGSGIGLSLSRQIMRAHGGTLSVESTPQNGTTFTLQF